MLEVENLDLKLGNFRLKSINLKIEDGEYFIILGPSGSGKTVFLETIAGRYSLDGGAIYHDGEDISKRAVEDREIGFVYQNYEIFPHMTVEENINFGPKLKKMDRLKREDNFKYLIKILDIGHLLKRYPKNLSGGEAQRVALARALIVEPKILLLDEPFSALDINIKLVLQREMKDIHKKLGATIIHVTHDIEEALYLGDKLAIMDGGGLRVLASMDNLKEEEAYLKDYFKLQMERWSEDGSLYRFMEESR